MKQLTCEMCGSNDLIKQNGVFVCQHCGTKYSVEEARNMMFSGNTEPSTTTIQIDNAKKIENLYQVARRAKEDGNTELAGKYYDLILQEDPLSWEASFYTIYCNALQTNIAGIVNSANLIRRCLHSVLKLIHDAQLSTYSTKAAVCEIKDKLCDASGIFYQNAINHYNGIDGSIQLRYRGEALERASAAADILLHYGDCIENIFGNDPELCAEAAESWQGGLMIIDAIQKLRHEMSLESDQSTNTKDLYLRKIAKYDAKVNLEVTRSDIENEIKRLDKIITTTQTTRIDGDAIKGYILIIPLCLFLTFILEGGLSTLCAIATGFFVLGLIVCLVPQSTQKTVENIKIVAEAKKQRHELEYKLHALMASHNNNPSS